MKFANSTTPLSHVAVVVFCIAAPLQVSAQEHEAGAEESRHRHEVAILLGHTHVGQGLSAEGGRRWLVLPSWGLNYNYWIKEHWAVGLHTDLINENFVVEEYDEEVLERERPIAPALMITYRPHHHWSFLLGGGMEFAEGDDLVLLRAGAEYTVHLSGSWETCASLAYDLRLNAYDSWTLGIGLVRLW